MSIEIVLQQMIIIFILIIAGILLFRRSLISSDTSKQISGIIVHLCNPALLICSAFHDGPRASMQDLITGTFIVTLSYIILIICSRLIPYILHVPREEHYAYRLITIYGNVGFIGIPLASAVLGSGSLIYVSLNNLVYNILMYTQGIATIKKAANDHQQTKTLQTPDTQKRTESIASRLFLLTKNFINVGTVSSLLTIILYVSNIRIPSLFSDTLDYIGRSTTFLSMLVLGVSVAQMPVKSIFSNTRLYFFSGLRMILIPAACTFLFRFITDNTLIITTTALMLSVPSGNMPLILSRQYDLESEVISQGIILSTILSLITIPIVTLLIS